MSVRHHRKEVGHKLGDAGDFAGTAICEVMGEHHVRQQEPTPQEQEEGVSGTAKAARARSAPLGVRAGAPPHGKDHERAHRRISDRPPGDGDEGALRRAQELVYDAWEAGTARERVRLARQALALSELCADAHVLLAENAARTIVEARDHYRRGVVAGEKALGPEAFERDAGRFWRILETRPYMRARSGFADCLWALGERSAAIGHYREMLRLNPNDNQGLRHVLMSWLFTTGDLDALEELLDAYDNDAFVEWAYAKVLLAFRKGDRADADASLAIAWKRNPMFPA